MSREHGARPVDGMVPQDTGLHTSFDSLIVHTLRVAPAKRAVYRLQSDDERIVVGVHDSKPPGRAGEFNTGAYAGSQGRAEWEIVEEALVSRLQGFYFGMRESRSVPATSEPSETVPFPRATG